MYVPVLSKINIFKTGNVKKWAFQNDGCVGFWCGDERRFSIVIYNFKFILSEVEINFPFVKWFWFLGRLNTSEVLSSDVGEILECLRGVI